MAGKSRTEHNHPPSLPSAETFWPALMIAIINMVRSSSKTRSPLLDEIASRLVAAEVDHRPTKWGVPSDSALEEAVSSELVSGAKIPC